MIQLKINYDGIVCSKDWDIRPTYSAQLPTGLCGLMNEIVGDQNCQNLRRIIHAGLICHLEFRSRCVTTSQRALSNQSTLFFLFYWASVKAGAFPQACLHVVFFSIQIWHNCLLTRTKLANDGWYVRKVTITEPEGQSVRFTFSWQLNSWNESRMPTLKIWGFKITGISVLWFDGAPPIWGIDFKLFPILLIWLW